MLDTTSLARLTQVMPALANLDAVLTDRVRAEGTPLHVPQGAPVFEEGSHCRAFVALLDGTIRVVKPSGNGRELLLYRVRPGESCVLTLSCLLGNAPYPARGVAESDLTGVGLSRDLFEELLVRDAAFRQSVLGALGERLSKMMVLVEEVAFHRLDQRLAGLLLRRGARAADGVVTATHQQLADDLGTSREIVSRILGSFETENLVRLGRKQIQVLDRARLEDRASASW